MKETDRSNAWGDGGVMSRDLGVVENKIAVVSTTDREPRANDLVGLLGLSFFQETEPHTRRPIRGLRALTHRNLRMLESRSRDRSSGNVDALKVPPTHTRGRRTAHSSRVTGGAHV